jgi:hypothetical protein
MKLPPRSADPRVVEYSPRCLAPFEHRGHDEIRTAHHVPAGKHPRVGSLKRLRLARRHAHSAVVVQSRRVERVKEGEIGSYWCVPDTGKKAS